MATTTSTRKASASVPMSKTAAKAAVKAGNASAVAAYDIGTAARLDIGRAAYDMSAAADIALLTAADRKAGKRADVAQVVADAINAHAPDGITRTTVHNIKRHYVVLDLMTRRDVGTKAQRAAFSEGAARAVPARLKEAQQVDVLTAAAKAAGRKAITAANVTAAAADVKAAADKKAGKKPAAKKAASKSTKGAVVLTPANVIAAMNAIAKMELSKDAKASLSAAASELIAALAV